MFPLLPLLASHGSTCPITCLHSCPYWNHMRHSRLLANETQVCVNSDEVREPWSVPHLVQTIDHECAPSIQGAILYCKGDCVTINSEESELPFIAQLLSYDRVNEQLEVRWLYRSQEVDAAAAHILQRYRSLVCVCACVYEYESK